MLRSAQTFFNKVTETVAGAMPLRAKTRRVSKTIWDQSRQALAIAMQAEESDNRTFELIPEHHKKSVDHPLRIAIFGCQGSGNSNQRAVADLLNKFCTNPDTRPDFILVLGDNVYDYGAHFAGDPAITECFDDIYLTYPTLNTIPFFLIEGNHDGGFQNGAAVTAGKGLNPNLQTGIKQSMHEVAHSYMPATRNDPVRGKVIYSMEDKKTIYSNRALNLGDLPSWNMPRRYYSLIAGDVQIFCLDSSTYVKEYLDTQYNNDNNQHTAQNNQALWLQKEVDKAKKSGKKIIFAQHHPINTVGKNAYHNDANIYLNHEDLGLAQVLFNISPRSATPYSTFLLKTFERQDLCPDQVWNAHDHNINYYNNKTDPFAKFSICQLTSGGGGGDLQERAQFTEQRSTGCFLKEFGLYMVSHTTGTDDFRFQIETINGKKLEFDNHSPASKIHYPEASPCDGPNTITEAEKVQEFIFVIETAIEKYLGNIGYEQHATHGNALGSTREHGRTGIDRAHDVWAYIRAPYPESYNDMIKTIEKMVNTYWTEPGQHSLISYINKETRQTYNKTIQKMAEECKNADITQDYNNELRAAF